MWPPWRTRVQPRGFDPGGKVGHAELRIGGSTIMLADEFPGMGHRGKSVRPVENQFYGDRMGTLEDPFGHLWSIATHVEDVSTEEMKRRQEEMFKKKP